MPLEVIQRSIGLFISMGVLFMMHRGRQIRPPATPSRVCKLSLKACTLLMVPAERNLYTTHKAGRAALGLSCGACFELPDPVYFGSGAYYSVSKAQKDPIPCFRGVKITVQSTKKRNSVLSGAKIEVESTKSVIFVLSAYNMS